MATSSTAVSTSGLVSGLDWKTIVNELITADSAPVTILQNQEGQNNAQLGALSTVATKITGLQTAVSALQTPGLFSSRTAQSATTATTWNMTVAAGAALGTYQVNVTTLATAAQRQGKSDIGTELSPSSTVTGLTLATMSTATAVTAGTFTVNGQQITIATSDSLQDVFDKIHTATGNDVTGSYLPSTDPSHPDTVQLHSASGAIILGAANDTSNFLSVMQLGNNGTDTVTSASSLGTVKFNTPLVSSGLRSAITAVDGSGNGTMTINGVPITYNINTDSLSAVVARINNSTAGVIATYDSTNDRVVLANRTTGDIGIGVNEAANGLADALGLTSGSTLARGKNAQFTINGGPTLSSMSNTLTSAVTGITGLSMTVNSETAQTINVAADTGSMTTAVQNFITAFNEVQSTIDSATTITRDASGNPTPSALSSNREVQNWAAKLQSLAFNVVSGVSGTVKQLADIGIDFSGITRQLSITDDTKFTNALSSGTNDVNAFFGDKTGGFSQQMTLYLIQIGGVDGVGGEVGSQQDLLNASNKKITTQITTLQAQLANERDTLTNSFINMENSLANIKSQNTSITQSFFGGSTSSSITGATSATNTG